MRNHKEFKKMISVFSKNLAQEIKIFPLFGFLKRFVINILLNYFYLLFKNREREYKKILSKDGLKRFKQYITSPLKRQLREYLKDRLPPSQISYFLAILINHFLR
jgi:hypothetical protein